jgi:hypothetical protein
MLSILLDIEWLLSTLFDASLLTFEPPETAAPFFLLSRFGSYRARFRARMWWRETSVSAGRAAALAVSLHLERFFVALPWNPARR